MSALTLDCPDVDGSRVTPIRPILGRARSLGGNSDTTKHLLSTTNQFNHFKFQSAYRKPFRNRDRVQVRRSCGIASQQREVIVVTGDLKREVNLVLSLTEQVMHEMTSSSAEHKKV